MAGDLDRGRRARPLDRGVVSPDAPSVGGGFKPRRRASALRRAGDTPSTRTMATTRAATPTRAFGARRASGPEAGPRRARAGARAWGARRFAASPGAHPLPSAGWRRARRCGGDARARRGVVVLALAGEARDEGADAVRRLKIFSVNDGAPRDPAARRVFRTFARLARLALPRLALPRARRRPRRASRRRSRRPPRFRSKRRGARPRPAPARARAPGRPTPTSGPGRHARRISRENTRLRATPTEVADEIFSAPATSKPASVFRSRARLSLRSRARSRATVLSHFLRPIISPRPSLSAQSTSCTTSAP